MLGLEESELGRLRKNDPRKKVVAWLIRKSTSVKSEWISERLSMGSASKLSSFVKEVEETKEPDCRKAPSDEQASEVSPVEFCIDTLFILSSVNSILCLLQIKLSFQHMQHAG